MEDWSNRISDRFKGYEIPESEGLWEDINATMTRKRRVRSILMWSGVAGSVVAAAMAIFVLLDVSGNGYEERIDDDRIEVLSNNGQNRVWNEEIPTANKLLAMNVWNDAAVVEEITKDDEDILVAGEEILEDEEEITENKENNDGRNIQNPMISEESHPINEEFHRYDIPYKKERKGKISTSLSYGNGVGSNSTSHGYKTFFLSRNDGLELNTNGATAGIMSLNGKEMPVMTQTKHHMPLRAGLNVRWEFFPKLSLETGLVYTLLSSELTSGSDKYTYVSKQKLNYIGIPLNLNYTFLETRFIGLYVSTGGMMEKCVGGKLSTDYISNGKVIDKTAESLRVVPLQWSVNLSAGFQFNIIRSTGIFIQPGISWYFDNKSPVETIYRTKPLNFDLRFGIRYSF